MIRKHNHISSKFFPSEVVKKLALDKKNTLTIHLNLERKNNAKFLQKICQYEHDLDVMGIVDRNIVNSRRILRIRRRNVIRRFRIHK